MSEESNVQRLRNFFREKSDEIYFEQTPRTQRRVDRFSHRIQKLNKRFNPIKKENVPQGREIFKRAIVGGATNFAEVLDGKQTRKRNSTKRAPPRKPRSRRSRVVK